MISILLTILKILGTILLVLLGIILVVLVLVLFVPVRYRLDAHRNLQEEAPVVAAVKATWLLGLISVFFSYPDAAYVNVKVFGITVYRSDKEPKPKKEKAVKKEKKAQDTTQDKDKDKDKDKVTEKEAKNPSDVTDKEKPVAEIKEQSGGSWDEIEEKGQAEEETAESAADNVTSEQESTDKESTADEQKEQEDKPALKRFFLKLWDKIKNIKYTIRQICDKIKHIVKNIRYYLKVIQSSTFKNAFSLCSGQLFALLKSISPKKVKGNLTIGTGDPASTGQVLAIYGMLYPILGNNISITPDFEQQIIEGKLFVKGRITAFKALKMALVIYFNKDVGRVIKLLKREAA